MAKRKIILGSKKQRMNRIFGRENESTLEELGYDKMDDFEQARFREMIIRDAMTNAFNKSKEETA
jgi:hypothetical protein